MTHHHFTFLLGSSSNVAFSIKTLWLASTCHQELRIKAREMRGKSKLRGLLVFDVVFERSILQIISERLFCYVRHQTWISAKVKFKSRENWTFFDTFWRAKEPEKPCANMHKNCSNKYQYSWIHKISFFICVLLSSVLQNGIHNNKQAM